MSQKRMRQINKWFDNLECALGDSEVPCYVCEADSNGVRGLLVVTNNRLLWVSNRTIVPIDIAAIASVDIETVDIRFFVSSLTIEVDASRQKFTEMEGACALDVAVLLATGEFDGVSLDTRLVALLEPKPVERLGPVGLLSATGGVSVGALIVVPMLRPHAEGAPVTWLIAAVLLVLIAAMLGRGVDFVTGSFVDGYKQTRLGKR
jgi:hypothetical protein